jgi:hypothetical protein
MKQTYGFEDKPGLKFVHRSCENSRHVALGNLLAKSNYTLKRSRMDWGRMDDQSMRFSILLYSNGS